MSWRMPCPGAVEENKEIVNTCASVYSIYLCVIYMQVCPCGLFMLMPWAALLKHNESCAESRTHFSSVSFSQIAFKWKLWNLCDGKMYSVCEH